MRRRHALLGIAGIWFAAAMQAVAQGRAKLPVIGLLDGGDREFWWEAFHKQMQALGYVEGKNVSFERRFAKGRIQALPALAHELVKLNVAVIVTASAVATHAAKNATDKIPIVTATGSDHVAMGFANSLARPGGNVTGMASISSDLTGKRLELVREAIPGLSRLAVLWQSDNEGSRTSVRDLERATGRAKTALQNIGMRKGEDLPEAFAAAVRERAQAVFVVGGPMMTGLRKQIADLALKHKVPTMSTGSEYVEAGGFISYGPDYYELFRRSASYVDRILKGAPAGDLPIEQASKLEMVINRRTAKTLGIAIPQALLVRADRVID